MALSEQVAHDIEALADGEGTSDIVAFLDDLPPERDREWELRLTRLIENFSHRTDDIYEIIESDSLQTDHDPDFVRFAAFFAYCTYHRRNDNATEFRTLLERHNEFEDRPMFPHLRSLQVKMTDELGSGRKAITHAREAIARVGTEHQGVTHSLATAILNVIEDDGQELEELDASREALLEEAESKVRAALSESDYPKFHATLGRVLALQGQHGAAIAEIHEAIDKEDDTKDDYALRISNYRSHEYRITLRKYSEEMNREQETIREEQADLNQQVEAAIDEIENTRAKSEERIRNLQTQTLQFLGFFATLIAVIISSVQIATTLAVLEAAILISILTGGLLVAFGGFSFILPGEKVLRRSAAVFGAGFCLVVVGLLVLLA